MRTPGVKDSIPEQRKKQRAIAMGGSLLPFEHVKPEGRGYGERERADKQHWTLPKPEETPESLEGRRSLQQTENRL